MNGYLIALVLLVAALIIWTVLLTHRLLWSECRHVIDQHLGRHLVLGLALLSLLAIVVPPAAFQLGRDTQTRHDAAYFAQRYKNTGLAVQHFTRPLVAAPVPKNLPAVQTVTIAKYPGVGDQGQQGACFSWADAWVMAYNYRLLHPNHPGIKFSPAWLFSYYADQYNGGQDGGSWAQVNEIVPQLGIPQFNTYPAPQAIRDPFPTQSDLPAVYSNAAKFRMPVTAQTLYLGDPSDQVYSEAKVALAQGQPALLSVNVTPSFDAATQNGGRIWYQGAESSRGGHEIVILAIDDTMTFPDGSVGGALVQNQWSKLWGSAGRAWVSRAWLAANAWGVLMMQGVQGHHAPRGGGNPGVTTARTTTPKGLPALPTADGGRRPYHGDVPPGPHRVQAGAQVTVPAPRAAGWYVSPFSTRDSGVNIAPIINAAGDAYHIWPVYVLAVVFAESGGFQYAWHDWGWPDISGGLTQETVQTLATYGVCNNDVVCARAWEWNATNSIYMGTRILRDYMNMTGVGYPSLWQCYNAGPGSCRSPYYAAFLQNYYTALTYATNTSPTPPPPPPTPTPTPAPFPRKTWGAHHRHLTPYYHHHLSLVADFWWHHAMRCGAITGHEQWHPARQYMQTPFDHCQIFTWPTHPGSTPRVLQT